MLDGSGAQDITVDLRNGTASGSEIGSDSLIAIEDVLTGDGNDHLTGDDQDNRLDAGGGNDTISSGAGNDSIYGRNGDDLIDGGDGRDTAHFNGNFSDYEVTPTSNGFTITDTRAFHDGTDQLSSIELFAFADQTLTPERLPNSHDIDLDGAISPLTDGLILTTAAYAIEVASGALTAPASFNGSLLNAVIHPSSNRSTPAAIKAHLTTALSSSSLESNDNGIVDLQDAESMIRSAMGTFPGNALSSDLAESALTLGSSLSLNLQQQIQVIDQTGWLG